MRNLTYFLAIILLFFLNSCGNPISIKEGPAQLDFQQVGDDVLRITLKPIGTDIKHSPALADNLEMGRKISFRKISKELKRKIGNFNLIITPDPLRIEVSNLAGQPIQILEFLKDGTISFALDDAPVLGMGEGGPKQGKNWRDLPIEFDRRGRFHNMQPRWQANAYGSRNPVPLLIGTQGWGIFVNAPWVNVDMQDEIQGRFIPYEYPDSAGIAQTQRNQQKNLGKGLPPASDHVPGLVDLFIFDAHNPADLMKSISMISGPSVMPPKWSLGYMQSHRTLETDDQMLGIVDSFREKEIPLDAVIYLGTGFCPQGWNTEQPSFDFNPEVFLNQPTDVISELHQRQVKVVVHIVPWDRDLLPGLSGTIPPKEGEELDNSHILNYWKQHEGLIKSGIDAFWPDEGDWFNLNERIKRHQMYYQGSLFTTPNVRPWSLHRNGYLGIAKWGGWVWSGDTDSSWKTLEGQIAVGINHSLSIGPYWGSDIGGFYPNEELTGELYARWFQFGAFCGSFRSHGRTWWTRLPWGWGLDEMGPIENRRNPLRSELNNPEIEKVCKKFAQLRYQLLPYTYGLSWEARETGMPLMRAMWLHYPNDTEARSLGDQYLWGQDLLIAPVYLKDQHNRQVYLPEGDWYDWWSHDIIKGGRTISYPIDLMTMPIFVRAGAIIPVEAVRQYTAQKISEPTKILIFPGINGHYSLYEDDGISLEYLKGKSTSTIFSWDNETKVLTIEPKELTGSGSIDTRIFMVEVIGLSDPRTVEYSGVKVSVKM